VPWARKYGSQKINANLSAVGTALFLFLFSATQHFFYCLKRCYFFSTGKKSNQKTPPLSKNLLKILAFCKQ
jgi:hypothetical protein